MISKSIAEGFKFALSLKRIITYIILDLIVFYIMITSLKSFVNLIRTETFNILRFFLTFAWLIPAFIIIGLVQIWVNGAMVDQAKYFPRERSLGKSFEYSTSRYLSLLCALVIYGIINAILSNVRYVGFILTFVFGLIMYYLYPAVIVGKKRCLDSLKESYKIFRKYPLETFVTWLLQSIISLIVIGVLALPLVFLFIGSIIGVFRTMIPTAVGIQPRNLIQSVIPGVVAGVRSPYFVPYLFLLVVGLSFTKLFNLGVQTRLYINARKMAL